MAADVPRNDEWYRGGRNVGVGEQCLPEMEVCVNRTIEESTRGSVA